MLTKFSFAQNIDSTSFKFKSTSLSIKNPIQNIRFGGYFRFFGYVRDLPTMYPLSIDNYYSGEYPQQTTISVGTGYREPMMLLSISGTAKKNINFGTDLMLNSPFNGRFDNNFFGLNLGTNFYSTLTSNVGKYKVHAGGISWYKQSKMTVWSEEGFLRYSLFERAPYDPLTKTVSSRYDKYYNQGTIDQDIRFSNVAFQGITFNASEFPWWFLEGVSLQSILGKTQNNIANIVSVGKDDYCFGSRLSKKTINNNTFAFNYFESSTTVDSTSEFKRSYDITTFEFDFKFSKINIFGEVGLGSYESLTKSKSYGEAIIINVSTPKKYTLIPLQFQYSNIAAEVVNVNASFRNSSVIDLLETTTIEEGLNPTIMSGFGGPITNLGYLSNNRQGFSLNTEFELNDFTISGGLGFYSEIDRINSTFSYNHITTGLFLSRLSYFTTGYGPYGHLNSFYRGVYENVNVVDSNLVDSLGNPLFDKFYNSSDLHIKYKTKLFNRYLYVFCLSNFNTAQDFFSVLPVNSSKSFIRQFNNQIDLCYLVNENFSLVFKHGFERVIANSSTNVDDYDPFPIDATGQDLGIINYIPSFKPRNQIGNIFGFGVDIKLLNGAYLFLRHSQFSFEDKNFAETNIRGSESTIELKINF